MESEKIISNIELVRNNININSEMYTIILSIIIFYYYPYMFFSIILVFSLYGLYTNVIADLQFDIKINTTKKLKNKNLVTIDFDKPIETKMD
jgi:hypothetical protein